MYSSNYYQSVNGFIHRQNVPMWATTFRLLLAFSILVSIKFYILIQFCDHWPGYLITVGCSVARACFPLQLYWCILCFSWLLHCYVFQAYLSLPEGTASVVGLIAMMTDHYANLVQFFCFWLQMKLFVLITTYMSIRCVWGYLRMFGVLNCLIFSRFFSIKLSNAEKTNLSKDSHYPWKWKPFGMTYFLFFLILFYFL